jgi:hypothetical protein
MAQNYTIVTQYPDVETDGGQFARDVMVVGTVSSPHGVYFENRYPRKGFTSQTPINNSNGFAIIFEDLFTIPNVDSVVWGQELNAANQLQDFVTVYVVSDSGESSNFFKVLYKDLTHDVVAAQVPPIVEELNAAEAA